LLDTSDMFAVSFVANM